MAGIGEAVAGPPPQTAPVLPVPSQRPPSDNPQAYIPWDRRRALAAGVELPDVVEGSALFADISGFTPLTESLVAEFGPQRGAEELTANLSRVFHAIIEDLYRFGGEVIYFSGDAVTCWLDGDDGIRAAACGLAMQQTIERVGQIRTPAGEMVKLAMKVAIAVGSARRLLVGDPEIQLIDVLAGRLIDELAAAEHQAERGDVMLEQSALESLRGAGRGRRSSGGRHERTPQRRRPPPAGRRPRCRQRACRDEARRSVGRAVGVAGRLRADASGQGRVPRRACGPRSRCSCVSVASTTTTTRQPPANSTISSAARSASSPPTAATCSSSPSATRARTSMRCSGRHSPTRTTRRARRRPPWKCASSKRRRRSLASRSA